MATHLTAAAFPKDSGCDSVAPECRGSETPAHACTTSAVVRAMRRMEARPTDTGRRRAQTLEECRQVLGATSVALCHLRQNGELAILNAAGNPPEAAMVEEIITRASRRPRDWFSIVYHGASADLGLAGRGSDLVYAVLPGNGEPWVADFLAFVAERLIHSAAARSDPGQLAVSGPGGLVLPPEMVIGPSVAMRELLRQMSATVSSGLDVLLSGETGTGKELLARIVHASGPTRLGPFVAVNCAAIPADLLEAELFGVERRVATGVDPRAGLFVQADRGSMFLDEIGDLPERLQAKLLRVLQEREVLALGAARPRKISARIISASNRALPALVTEGQFRADLYYRLRGLEFRSPSLRHRSNDIPALVLEFLSRAAEEYGKRIDGITTAALELLQQYPWPGNVRELQTEVCRAVLLCANGESLQPEHFNLIAPAVVPTQNPAVVSLSATEDVIEANGQVVPLRERINAVERVEILRAMRFARGNRSLAARMLGITRNGLAQKMRRLGMEQ